jgi:hypothetical protein
MCLMPKSPFCHVPVLSLVGSTFFTSRHRLSPCAHTLLAVFALTVVAEALPTGVRLRAPIECPLTTWHDVLIFFLINYLTHAMTVKTLQGETATASIFYQIVALFLPFSGALRGI